MGTLGRALPHAQHHQIDMVHLHRAVHRHPADLKIARGLVRNHRVHAPPLEMDTGRRGAVAVALEGFTEGAHVHEINRGVQGYAAAGGPFAGHHGLLDGVHAADGGAKIRIVLPITGSDALEPGNPGDEPAVGRPHQLAAGRPGAAEQAFEFDTRDHIRQRAVAVSVFAFGRVVIAGAPAHDDGAHFQFGTGRDTQALVDLDDLGNQGVGIEGLDQIVQGPDFHGFHGGFHGGIGCHHDHRKVGKKLFGLLEDFHAVHAGHLDIQQHELIFIRFDFLQGFGAAFGHADPKPAFDFEPLLEGVPHDEFVIHH